MSAMPGGMTVDRLMARLAELEGEHARLQREYLRIGEQLLAQQAAWPRPVEGAPAGAPAASGGED
jgi:hypothetical protein